MLKKRYFYNTFSAIIKVAVNIKKRNVIKFILIIILVISTVGIQNNNRSLGEELYQEAFDLEDQKSFSQAVSLYSQVLPILIEEKNMKLATECSEAIQRLTIFEWNYPYTSEQIEDILQQDYPQATMEQIKSWISSEEMEHYVWDGEEHFFYDASHNLMFRHLELLQANNTVEQSYYNLVLDMNQIVQNESECLWTQYYNASTYRGIHTISIPRDELPDVGVYRIWFPVPINSGSQTNVVIESVIPDKWVKQPSSVNQDIGLLYMEIPMEELKEDLFIQIEFTFTHYEQRFSVDPNNVGEYDKDSALYQNYTKSYGNTEITSDIRTMAANIVGDETNPYLAARKIYDYIINNVDYSFMPHFIMWPWSSQTESTYVYENQRGDCGAQSIYFSALCRSLGIPARTTGGWQLFKDEFNGHFWAEFYLPNYGWIPVDTSCAQLALYPIDLTDEQRQTFIDFYFGNQDSMRCVVQSDIDIPLIPQANGLVLLPMAIQTPVVEYSLPTGEIPGDVFLQHWTMQCEKISS